MASMSTGRTTAPLMRKSSSVTPAMIASASGSAEPIALC